MSEGANICEPFKEGDEFLQYRIHSLLGRGGHAFVYGGQHRYMERPVAIKMIPAVGAVNTEIHKRAQLEARILSQLEHPNVVKIYDAGVTDAGIIYIVMEMLEGWTLRAALRNLRTFTVPEALHVGIQVASAVEMAHSQNAIHRDLKPENVFLLPGNAVKVLDFGISKLLGTNSAMTTQPHLIRGTPQYMSPEHMEGRAVTVRSDIYALGSVLYELLTAIAPALVGLQEVSSYAIGYSQIHRMPPRIDELSPDVPRYVARSIQRMLAKDPEQRPATMRDVTEELRKLQARFAAESPARAAGMRELWHAPLLAPSGGALQPPSSAGPLAIAKPTEVIKPLHSPAVRPLARVGSAPENMNAALPAAGAIALLVPRKTKKSAPEQDMVPGPSRPLRAPDAMALRLAERRSSSAPVPVTLLRTRARTSSHTASLLIAAVVLGSIIGYGALMSIRRANWATRSPDASAHRARAAALGEGASGLPSTDAGSTSVPLRGVDSSTAPVLSVSQAVGAALATAQGASVNSSATSTTARQSPQPGLVDTRAAQNDPSTARVSKDAPLKHITAKAPASTVRPTQSPAKDQLIFGAEDLTW